MAVLIHRILRTIICLKLSKMYNNEIINISLFNVFVEIRVTVTTTNIDSRYGFKSNTRL